MIFFFFFFLIWGFMQETGKQHHRKRSCWEKKTYANTTWSGAVSCSWQPMLNAVGKNCVFMHTKGWLLLPTESGTIHQVTAVMPQSSSLADECGTRQAEHSSELSPGLGQAPWVRSMQLLTWREGELSVCSPASSLNSPRAFVLEVFLGAIMI